LLALRPENIAKFITTSSNILFFIAFGIYSMIN